MRSSTSPTSPRSPSGPDPAAYARYMKAVVPAIKAANPNVKILLAGELNATQDSGANTWVDTMYAAVADLNNYFDAWTMHPYGHDPDTYTSNARYRFRRIEDVHAKFNAHGAGTSTAWITELGNATNGGSSAESKADQADFLKRYITIAKGYGWVDAFFNYHYNDLGCSNSISATSGSSAPTAPTSPPTTPTSDSATAARTT